MLDHLRIIPVGDYFHITFSEPFSTTKAKKAVDEWLEK